MAFLARRMTCRFCFVGVEVYSVRGGLGSSMTASAKTELRVKLKSNGAKAMHTVVISVNRIATSVNTIDLLAFMHA